MQSLCLLPKYSVSSLILFFVHLETASSIQVDPYLIIPKIQLSLRVLLFSVTFQVTEVDLMDDDTRFWIAQHVADTKNVADLKPLFKNAKVLTGKRPSTLTSDGAPNFNDAFKNEFFIISNPRSRHIRHVRMRGDHNNNKMERMNGEVRDREKVMRGLKKIDTIVLPGYQLYHNYIRPHEGLDGKTPAEKCGIKIEGDNKWKTLIKNATSDSIMS
jgi:putative transposase